MQPPPRPVGHSVPSATPPGCRVLVVDHGDTAENLALLLSLWGHSIRVTPDGPGALRLAREYRPDVVFVDLGLPGLGGYAVARRLRREPGLDLTLLVALAGTDQQPHRSYAAGFDVHLTRPVESEMLRKMLADGTAAAREG